MKEQVEAVLGILRPAMRADGRDIQLVAVDAASGLVQVEISGGCAGCSGPSETRTTGVERILVDRVPGVSAVERVCSGAEVPAGQGCTPVTL